MAINPIVFDKSAGDQLLYAVEFGQWPIIEAGDTINSNGGAVDNSTPSGLTFTSVSVSGSQVRVIVSGGTAGTTYTTRVRATLASGYILEQPVTFNVT